MRVLQLHVRYRTQGGEDQVVDEEASLLRSAGHDVVQLLRPNPADAWHAAQALLLSAWNPPVRSATQQVAAAVLPDVAHVHNTWFALSPAALAGLRDAGVPVVMTLHNYRLMCANAALFRNDARCTDCVGRLPWRAVWHRCYHDSTLQSAIVASGMTVHRALNTWAHDVDLFLTPTHRARELLIQGGIPAARTQVKPHFVEDPGVRPARPSTSPTVLYVGRLSSEKGLPALLQAWDAAGDTGLTLRIIGDGPLLHELLRRASPTVEVLGSRSHAEVRAEMVQARALVAPSVTIETFGMTVLEAMAAGLPVVTSPDGASAEVTGGRGALLPPVGDRQAWATALRQLADDQLVDALGEANRQTYLDCYTPAIGLTNLMAAYATVLRRDQPLLDAS